MQKKKKKMKMSAQDILVTKIHPKFPSKTSIQNGNFIQNFGIFRKRFLGTGTPFRFKFQEPVPFFGNKSEVKGL